MDVDQNGVSDTVYLRVRDHLDEEKARKIAACVRRLDPARRVIVDFHEVRVADSVALALLARTLLDVPQPVTLRGLSAHHHRILRYVGLPRRGPAAAGGATADGR